jgi:hypothetical protein
LEYIPEVKQYACDRCDDTFDITHTFDREEVLKCIEEIEREVREEGTGQEKISRLPTLGELL